MDHYHAVLIPEEENEEVDLLQHPVTSHISNSEFFDDGYPWTVPFIQAMQRSNWGSFERLLILNPRAEARTVDEHGHTFLHVAISIGNVDFAIKLLNIMTAEDLELKTNKGNVALVATVGARMKDVAELMVEKNEKLVRMRDEEGLLPVVTAARSGNKEMTHYLYSKTPLELLDPEISETSTYSATLLTELIISDMYDVALKLLEHYQKLAIVRDIDGRSAVSVLAKKPSAFSSRLRHPWWKRVIYNGLKIERKSKQEEVHEILDIICSQVSSLDQSQLSQYGVSEAVIDASKHGIARFVRELIKWNCHLQFTTDEFNRGIFQNSVVFRQEKVFNLIHDMKNKDILLCLVDKSKNNLLHQAALYTPSSRTNKIAGAAFQFQRELQWFKEIEKLVPPRYKEDLNKDGKTPNQLFKEQHKDFVTKAETWMKETSKACMLVSTLIATVMLTGTFTVPGGVRDSGGVGYPYPVYEGYFGFNLFLVMDILSLFYSCCSLLIFLAILTSRYTEKDFLVSLPRKLMLGLVALFISVATMMGAFFAGITLVVPDGAFVFAFFMCLGLSAVPITLFVVLQFSLVFQMVYFTYGPSILGTRSFGIKEIKGYLRKLMKMSYK